MEYAVEPGQVAFLVTVTIVFFLVMGAVIWLDEHKDR